MSVGELNAELPVPGPGPPTLSRKFPPASNFWIRLLPLSATHTLPVASVATPYGPLNCPFAVPNDPNLARNTPFASNFWIRLLPVSATYTFPAKSVATPAGPAEPAVAGRSVKTPGGEEGAVRVELLDAVVQRVGDVDGAARSPGDPFRSLELPWICAVRAPLRLVDERGGSRGGAAEDQRGEEGDEQQSMPAANGHRLRG